MPGYWNRPASGQQEKQEPRSWRASPHGGGNNQSDRQSNLDKIRRDAEEKGKAGKNPRG